MGSIEDAMKSAQLETEVHELRAKLGGARQVLGLARCIHCSEQIADQEWVVTDDDEISHAGECAEAHARYIDDNDVGKGGR